MRRFSSAFSCSIVVLLAIASYQQFASQLTSDPQQDAAVDVVIPRQEFGHDFELPIADAAMSTKLRFMLANSDQ